jgi:hypothetical protein
MEQEKDNFWLYIGGVIVLTIALVLMLQKREVEGNTGGDAAYNQLKAETQKQIDAAKAKK